jgi:hypothetical protein
MTTEAIGFGDALRAQLILLHHIGRVRLLAAAAALGVLFTIVGERFIARVMTVEAGVVILGMLPWIVLVGAAWGIATWWQEPPSHRDQVLSGPVDITSHELARIAAGGLWLLTLLTLTTGASLIVQAAAGRAAALGGVAPAAWVLLFSAPLLAYVLTVTIATGARRSIVFAVAGLVLLGAAYAVAISYLVSSRRLEEIIDLNRYSLFTALGAGATSTTTTTTYEADGTKIEQSATIFGSHMDPYWLDASLLWWTIAAAALAFVLWRRRRA